MDRHSAYRLLTEILESLRDAAEVELLDLLDKPMYGPMTTDAGEQLLVEVRATVDDDGMTIVASANAFGQKLERLEEQCRITWPRRAGA